MMQEVGFIHVNKCYHSRNKNGKPRDVLCSAFISAILTLTPQFVITQITLGDVVGGWK